PFPVVRSGVINWRNPTTEVKMRYLKLIDGRLAEYSGPQMGAAWHAAEGWLPYAGMLNVDWLYVDAAGTIAELSDEEYAALHPVAIRELVDGEKVIAAAYDLVSPTAIASVMSDPGSIKDALAGLALLTTKKAPDGMIDLLDPMVSHWFSLAGITVDQVREAIKLQ
ncbi:MAG: hypothetical protein AB7F32_13890, partial [Victivallaceae bacterium]